MPRFLTQLGLFITSVAMVLALAPHASAQFPGEDTDGDGLSDLSVDGDPIGGGVHFIVPDLQPNPDGDTGSDGDSDDDAGDTLGTGGGDSSTTLAATGSDVEPIVAMSLGLLALGGSVLVTSRRRIIARQ